MTGEQQGPGELTRDVERLRRRLDEVEAGIARTGAAAGGLSVVLGACLPLVDVEDATAALILAPADLVGLQDTTMRSNLGGLWLLTIGATGLLVMLVGCLWLFARVWGRGGTQRTARVGGTFAVLAAVGSGVMLIASIAAAAQPDASTGPGIWFLLVGVLLALALSKTYGGRALWADREDPRIRRRGPAVPL